MEYVCVIVLKMQKKNHRTSVKMWLIDAKEEEKIGEFVKNLSEEKKEFRIFNCSFNVVLVVVVIIVADDAKAALVVPHSIVAAVDTYLLH